MNSSLIKWTNHTENIIRTIIKNKRFITSIGKTGGRLVILGTGWAGLKCLHGIDTKNYQVVVISPRNHFIFTPLLASTAVGTLEFRAIAEPIRMREKSIDYYVAWCDAIDLKKKVLECTAALEHKNDKFNLSFDKLVITVGAYANTFNIPGVKEHALFLKEVKHAMAIRQRIIECFEHASEPNVTEQDKLYLLHFAIVGGGPTGVEFSAELHDFIMEDLRKLYPNLMDKVQITVFDNAERILGGFDTALAEYATRKFFRKGIQIRTKTKIIQVTKNHLVLEGNQQVAFGTLVWATGITATPLIRNLPVMKDSSSRVITDEYLKVLDEEGNPIPDVFALGDCAAIKNNALPATAQVAAQKGIWLKKHLNSLIKTADSKNISGKPFVYQHMGSMVYTGGWSALMDLRGATTWAKGIKGRVAWFIWRSAYLTMSVSAKNKALIPMYWILTWIFGRDISKF